MASDEEVAVAQSGELPKQFWLGKIQGEWPVYAFISEEHVIRWLAEAVGTTLKPRRAWGFQSGVVYGEVEVVITEPRLVSKGHVYP